MSCTQQNGPYLINFFTTVPWCVFVERLDEGMDGWIDKQPKEYFPFDKMEERVPMTQIVLNIRLSFN